MRNWRELWPWLVDRYLISLELVFFFAAFFLFGGMSRLGAGTDSVGEWLSNFFVLRFMREDLLFKARGIANPHCATDEHDAHDHTREKAVENVAIVFFGLAVSTLVFHLLAGEQLPSPDNTWIDWTAGGFTLATGLVAVAKLMHINWEKGSPSVADVVQSFLCVIASLITVIADWYYPSYPRSHTVGEIVIVILMLVAGTVILKTKKLCC